MREATIGPSIDRSFGRTFGRIMGTWTPASQLDIRPTPDEPDFLFNFKDGRRFTVKKMRIALAALTAMAVAAPAMALNVEWHGDLNNRFSYSTQADLSRRVVNDTQSFISLDGKSNYQTILDGVNTKKNSKDSDFFGEIKYRMNLDVSDDDKKVKGVVGFEFGSSKFGGSDLPFGGDQKNVLELMWAYTDIQLPFDPASRLIIGLQPVGYNYLLWTDNAAGVKWARKDASLAYSLGWFRDDVGSTLGGEAKDRYNNAYLGDMTYTFANGNSLNGFIAYLEKRNEDQVMTSGNHGGFWGGEINEALVGKPQDQQIWLGLSGRGKWNNFSGLFTGMYLTGELKTAGTLNEKYDREGYLFHGQIDYKMDNTTFTLGGLYTSGDKDNNDRKLKNFAIIDATTGIFGSVIIFDNLADDNSFSQAPYLFDKGYALLYAGARHELTKKAWVSARYLWHNTAEKLNGASTMSRP
jgi:hypothetical protein